MSVFIDKLSISSADIKALDRIPEEFSADGGNKVPQLEITGLPEGTKELTVILYDPDAPMPHGFSHWILHGLPATEGEVSSDDGRLGPNTMGEAKYVGPFPPPGHGTHHYYFLVYALDTTVEGEPTREEFLDKYSSHIIEQARFVATFSA